MWLPPSPQKNKTKKTKKQQNTKTPHSCVFFSQILCRKQSTKKKDDYVVVHAMV